MALNFSPFPIFPASSYPAADGCDFFSSIWDRGTEAYGNGGCHYYHWREVDPSYDHARDAGGGGWSRSSKASSSCSGGPSNAAVDPSYDYARDSGGGGWAGSCKGSSSCSGGSSNAAAAAGSGGGGYTDIVDLLPSDPFGMELGSTLTAAIAGWIGGHLGVDQPCCGDFFGAVNCSNGLLAGFGSLCSSTGNGGSAWSAKAEADHFPEKVHYGGAQCVQPFFNGTAAAATCTRDANLRSVSWDEEGWIRTFQYTSQHSTGEGNVSQSRYHASSSDSTTGVQADKPSYATNLVDESFAGRDITGCSGGEACPDEDDVGVLVTRERTEIPHDGLLLALGYLGVQDLLSVEMVCKTMRSVVREDPFRWKCVHISAPLNERLTDEALLSLTERAAGNLHCLSLVECSKITDEGLRRVFEANPRLTKLSVPGCRLSVEVLIDSLKILKATGMPGIKHLRISGLYGVTQAHYEDLKALLGMDQHLHPKPHKPQFYHSGLLVGSCDYDLPLDIEVCPRCQNLRLVYDCPAESCQGQDSDPCRGCRLCIARCLNCGKCINDSEYEETFYLDYLCSVCVKHLIASEDPQQKGSGYCDLIPVLPVGADSS